MANPFVKLWNYMKAWGNATIDDKADPKIQIQQAIEDAQRQHQALSQQAAAVIGNQRQLEMKLNRQLEDVERLQSNVRQALTLADQATALKSLGYGRWQCLRWLVLPQALTAMLPEARLLRIDRDTTRRKDDWDQLYQRIQAEEVDVLVGTQMLAKGHDFPKLTLVGALGADAALFASDWRAPERLFAQLMQVAGRAGRAELPGEVLIQTQFPEHPLYAALVRHDYPAFADAQLKEREQAGFPPYAYQAMLRAEAPQLADSLAFLTTARAWPEASAYADVMLYDPVPMRMARRANFERAQLLIESPSRRALQHFLADWGELLATIKAPSRLRWHLEVDPLEF